MAAPKDAVAGGSAGGGNQAITYQQVRDMVDAVEKHVEARTSGIETRLDHTLAQLPTFHQTIYIVGGVAFTLFAFLVASIIAVLSFGGDRFDAGMNLAGGTVRDVVKIERMTEENANQIKALIDIVKRQREDGADKSKAK